VMFAHAQVNSASDCRHSNPQVIRAGAACGCI